jgi:polyisoprenoid-binding protein YceI
MPIVRLRHCTFAALIAMLVCACVQRVDEPAQREQQIRPGIPQRHYADALRAGKPVFRVDAARSLVVIEVRRAGALARFGHDHVVASHDIQGYVSPAEQRADLRVELARLTVDEPELRTEAGFVTAIPAASVEGTRQNMLNEVLEAERYPYAEIEVTAVQENSPSARVNFSLTLHGKRRALESPVVIERNTDTLEASGAFTLTQSDFGITPFAILGGAIAIQDALSVRFRIHARRIAGDSDF